MKKFAALLMTITLTVCMLGGVGFADSVHERLARAQKLESVSVGLREPV